MIRSDASSAEARAYSDVVGVVAQAVGEHDVEDDAARRAPTATAPSTDSSSRPRRPSERPRASSQAVSDAVHGRDRGRVGQRARACGAAGRCRRRACCRGRSRRAATPCGSAPGVPRTCPGRAASAPSSRNSVGVSVAHVAVARDRGSAGRAQSPRRVQRRFGARAPDQRVQPRHHLLDVERLRHVVVAAGPEATEPVGERVARGQEQHRRAALPAPAAPGTRRGRRRRAARCRSPARRALGSTRSSSSWAVAHAARVEALGAQAATSTSRSGARPRRSAGVGGHARRKYRAAAAAPAQPFRRLSGRSRHPGGMTLELHDLDRCAGRCCGSPSAGCGSSSSSHRARRPQRSAPAAASSRRPQRVRGSGAGRAFGRGALGCDRRHPGQPGVPGLPRPERRLLDQIPGGLDAERRRPATSRFSDKNNIVHVADRPRRRADAGVGDARS